MKTTSLVCAASGLLLLPCITSAASNQRKLRGRNGASPSSKGGSGNNNVVRWASSGGGWRAMVADMGFANAFHQAGLLGGKRGRGRNKNDFSAVSATSGGSWFSTQFFYSQEFYKHTLGRPSELSDFVTTWMEAYLGMQESVPSSSFCQSESFLLNLVTHKVGINATDLCEIFMQYNGDWALFVTNMFNATAAAYNDPTFATVLASPYSRIAPLANTDLYLQMSLAPNARCESTQSIGYVSPFSTTSNPPEVYAVPLAAQHAIKANYSFFHVSVEAENLPLSVSVAPAPVNFSLTEFETFYLYPGTNGQVTTSNPSPSSTAAVPFQPPFGADPNVAQVAAASSAVLGAFSGSVPSLLAQSYSLLEDYIATVNMTAEMKELLNNVLGSIVDDDLYGNSAFENMAVDTQWPSQCTAADGRLADGGFTDGLSLALNVGQYQTVDQGDLTQTLKLIVTDCNNVADDSNNFLSYFATTFNAGVAPGDFLWSSSMSNGLLEIDQMTPVRSPQIFQDSLDAAGLDALTERIAGTNLTAAIVNATTLDNPAFGIVAGQSAQILFLRINSAIPTAVIGTQLTQQYTEPLADLAAEIAGSQELVSLVESFLSS